MSLTEIITQDMKTAMKAKDNATLSTLRLLLSAIKNKQIDLQHPLTDAEVQDVLKSQVKQLKDSIQTFQQAGREDLATPAIVEVRLLEAYLPKQMEDTELEEIVKTALAQTGAQSKADMGKVMGSVMQVVAGRADGTRVKEMVGKLLGVLVFTFVGVGFWSMNAYAAVPMLESFSSTGAYTEFLLRIARVLLLWLGIFAITIILNGGFQYMTSLRDQEHTEAMTKITHGVFATIIIATLFAFFTIWLQ